MIIKPLEIRLADIGYQSCSGALYSSCWCETKCLDDFSTDSGSSLVVLVATTDLSQRELLPFVSRFTYEAGGLTDSFDESFARLVVLLNFFSFNR